MLFVAASVLIDVDHYVSYLIIARRIARLKTVHAHYMAEEEVLNKLPPGQPAPRGLFVLHSIEAFAAVSVLALTWPILWWVIAGGALHLALDIYDCRRRGINYTKYFSVGVYLLKKAIH